MDEMTKRNKEKNLENYKREIESITKQKTDVIAKTEVFKKKISLLEKNYHIIIDNFRFNEPKWDYEKVPEYIDNLREINMLSQEENRMNWKIQLEGAEQGLATLDEQLATLKEAVDKISKELEEAKEDGK